MGAYFINLTGGEPLLRKDLIDLLKQHSDIYFQIYTNGTQLTKDMAEQFASLGNVALAFSLEGFEKETNQRRGQGVFQKVIEAMRFAREAGLLFGFSATATSKNWQVVYSEKFIDFCLDQGCKFGWCSLYIPIGRNPDTSLMLTPQQRRQAGEWVRKEVRSKKPIFVVDFWNDGHFGRACMAGGKKYLHITSKGAVEPCVFTRFSTDTILGKSLKEILCSPLFMLIKKTGGFDGKFVYALHDYGSSSHFERMLAKKQSSCYLSG